MWYASTTGPPPFSGPQITRAQKKKTPRRQPKGLHVPARTRGRTGVFLLPLFSESGSPRQPLAARHKASHPVVSAVSVALTPLESLCFEQVSFWVGVVQRNQGRSGRLVEGRPYTRLPASELVSNLEERLPFLAITVRQVRSALNRLVQLGLLVREQFWQRERWRSDYWYSLPLTEAEAASQGPGLAAPEQPENPVKPGVSVLVTPREPELAFRGDGSGQPFLLPLASNLPEQNQAEGHLVSKPNSQPASRVDGKREPVVAAGSLQGPCRGQVNPNPAPTPTQHPLRSGNAAAPAKGTAWARIHALAAAFQREQVAPVSPSAVVLGGKVRRIDDGACAPLR